MRLWDGAGAARLLEADPENGALLLERLTPGREYSDGEISRLFDLEMVERIARGANFFGSIPVSVSMRLISPIWSSSS